MRTISLMVCCVFLINFSAYAVKTKNYTKTDPFKSNSKLTTDLLKKFSKSYKSNKELKKLKKEVLGLSGKAVPALIGVMKNNKYPDKNRWMATFLLGRIVGHKSVPFIAKFTKHPNWIMRMASLKTLLALKDTRHAAVYVDILKDSSFIVRTQALENIRLLNLTDLSPNVWAMLYDKRNYYQDKKKKEKEGTNIIKKVIKVIGEFKFQEAKEPLLKMIAKKKYNNVFNEIDNSLQEITGKVSPKGSKKVKKYFWSRIALAEAKI